MSKIGIEKEVCKGRFYRYTESSYVAKDGSIQAKEVFRLLKRSSCSGCEKCWWIEEDIAETIACEGNVPKYGTLTSGDTAYWHMEGYHDYEYGWQYEASGFKKVGGKL